MRMYPVSHMYATPRWEAIPTGVPLCREDKEQADTLDRLYTLLEKYMLVNKVQKSGDDRDYVLERVASM